MSENLRPGLFITDKEEREESAETSEYRPCMAALGMRMGEWTVSLLVAVEEEVVSSEMLSEVTILAVLVSDVTLPLLVVVVLL